MKEQILMQTENRVLRKIFGCERVEVTGHVTEVRSGLRFLLGKLHLPEGGTCGRMILKQTKYFHRGRGLIHLS
jgi:hypothetical protein